MLSSFLQRKGWIAVKIETLEVSGVFSAFKAMRNPLDSWARSDSGDGCLGEKDKELSRKLTTSGPEHAKHLRMIMVWADITMPRYWWTEFDTYRIGVEKISCSTMHTLTKHKLTAENFEHNCINPVEMSQIIDSLNEKIEYYEQHKTEPEAKDIWRNIIQLLPQSFLQTRTVMLSYAALRNIVRQRQGHKLAEWAHFIEWAKTLPESWMIFE